MKRTKTDSQDSASRDFALASSSMTDGTQIKKVKFQPLEIENLHVRAFKNWTANSHSLNEASFFFSQMTAQHACQLSC